jgi:beta-N-acetylhexosaminidase
MKTSSLERLAGAVVLGGFGESPARIASRLAAGLRAGAVVFRRNLPDLRAAHALFGELHAAALASSAGPTPPPLLAIDEEGGRVRRMPAPFPRLPPMRALGALGDTALTERAGRALGRALGVAGATLAFAPVADVDSNPANPVIGDRAFAADPHAAAAHATAFARGLDDAGLLACGKHFPGHGDTSVDSHVALPVVGHTRARLDAVELVPFRALVRDGVACLMTAHVVCPALAGDPHELALPATLRPSLQTALLRDELGFEGCLFSDDLEMAAVANELAPSQAAVEAVRAGCDAVLVCSDEDEADRAVEALASEASQHPRFAERLASAGARVLAARRRIRARQGTFQELQLEVERGELAEVASLFTGGPLAT